MSELTLAPTVAAYFATSGNRDALSLFSGDATVIDEGETHEGLDAIAAWLVSVEERYQPRYVLKKVQDDDGWQIITFEVSGTFPGSPATLRQAFRLDDTGKILHLQTL